MQSAEDQSHEIKLKKKTIKLTFSAFDLVCIYF